MLDKDIEKRLQEQWEKQIEAFRQEQPPEMPEKADMWDMPKAA